MRLTLLIPELLWSEPGDTTAHAPAMASSLAKILAQCRFSRQANTGWEAALLRLAGLHADSSLAVLRAIGDQFDPLAEEAPRWLCADPVHLRFHQDRLILADANELALETDELAGLQRRLNEALAGRAELFFCGPTRGYLKLAASAPDPTRFGGMALSRKIGCEVRPGDFGADATVRGLANELQMLLHDDPLNLARQAAGKPAVNALWLWGCGKAPEKASTTSANQHDQPPIDAIAGPHPLIAGVARTLGIPQQISESARHPLQFIDTLNTPTHYQDSAAYAAAWGLIDQQHLAPALTSLQRLQRRQIDLVAPVVFGELRWQISPLAAWLGRFNLHGRKRWPDLVGQLAHSAE